MTTLIRVESPSDANALGIVNPLAFGQKDEAHARGRSGIGYRSGLNYDVTHRLERRAGLSCPGIREPRGRAHGNATSQTQPKGR